MIKKIDLSGIWNFELDPDKKGLKARLFDKAKMNTITLREPLLLPKKELSAIKGNGISDRPLSF